MLHLFLQLPPVAFVRDIVQAYGRLGVSRAAAALAYFLILTLFPLLMCVNFFIGLLQFNFTTGLSHSLLCWMFSKGWLGIGI